jgi:hypothetical protein
MNTIINTFFTAVTAVTNPNAIIIDNFWIGATLTTIIVATLIYLGFKYEILDVPKFTNAKDFFKGLVEVVNRRATNEKYVDEYIRQIRILRDSVTFYKESQSDAKKMSDLFQDLSMKKSTAKLREYMEVVKKIEEEVIIIRENAFKAAAQINSENAFKDLISWYGTPSNTAKVEYETNTGWKNNGNSNHKSYVNAEYRPVGSYQSQSYNSQDVEFNSFGPQKFYTDAEIEIMKSNGTYSMGIYKENYSYYVVMKDNQQHSVIMTGAEIQKLQTVDKKVIGVHFIVTGVHKAN